MASCAGTLNGPYDSNDSATQENMQKTCCKDPADTSVLFQNLAPLTWFKGMVQHCYDYAIARKAAGAKIVGILCEYTPREIIMAAGGVPVCLCGGSLEMIGPAEEHLPPNLCPLIKSTYGYSLKKANPFLEMADLLIAETTCDGKKKMYELLSRRHPMYVVELPHKSQDPGALEHWVSELRKLKKFLEEKFDVEISNEKLRQAISLMNRERRLRQGIADLMKSDEPPMTGRELLEMKSLISCVPDDFIWYESARKDFSGRKIDPPGRSRVRILLTGAPFPHGAERVVDIIEKSGGIIVCQENCTGIKPLRDDVDENADDPLRAIARKYYHLPCSVMTENNERMELLRGLVKEYRPQGVVELIWQACLTYNVESFRIRELVSDELNLPYLRIETDFSQSDSARIALRVQALLETISNRL